MLLLLSLIYISTGSTAILVETPLGTIEGYTKTSFGGRTFLAFEGIPYAKPPVGTLRFEEPVPIEPWNETVIATAPTVCPQPIGLTAAEDCLHLNVYVPREEINPDEKLEVVVYIHGGAFLYGSGASSSSPAHAMDKDVIFVSLNYRLGILGFLSTEDDVVPGNNGFKDQVLALKWVQANIASFGGNPDSVTLVGMSAGSFGVHFHYFSPLSRGLFHRGFSQSGLALGPSAITEGSLDRAKSLGDSLGCPTDDNRRLVDCLKSLPYADITNKVNSFLVYNNVPIHPFGAVIEEERSNSFLVENPYLSLINGRVQELPFLVSNVKDEGLLFTRGLSKENIDNFAKNWNEVAPLLFDFNYTLPEDEWQRVSEEIRAHYFGEEKVSLETLTQVFNDRYWFYGTDETLKFQANATTSPVYYYIFAYPGDGTSTTVGHGAETAFMFNTNLSQNGLKMKDLIWDMIVSYAKTNTPKFGNVTFEPTTSQEDKYVQVNGVESEDIIAKTAEVLGDREFWESFNFAEHGN